MILVSRILSILYNLPSGGLCSLRWLRKVWYFLIPITIPNALQSSGHMGWCCDSLLHKLSFSIQSLMKPLLIPMKRWWFPPALPFSYVYLLVFLFLQQPFLGHLCGVGPSAGSGQSLLCIHFSPIRIKNVFNPQLWLNVKNSVLKTLRGCCAVVLVCILVLPMEYKPIEGRNCVSLIFLSSAPRIIFCIQYIQAFNVSWMFLFWRLGKQFQWNACK